MISRLPAGNYAPASNREKRAQHNNRPMASRWEAMGLLLCCDYFAFVLIFGSLLIVRRQRVQMFTLRITPLISRRRRYTFSTKRRRVRFCEKLELLPYSGLRSHISQRPDMTCFL